jgi:hypothetical protein
MSLPNFYSPRFPTQQVPVIHFLVYVETASLDSTLRSYIVSGGKDNRVLIRLALEIVCGSGDKMRIDPFTPELRTRISVVKIDFLLLDPQPIVNLSNPALLCRREKIANRDIAVIGDEQPVA